MARKKRSKVKISLETVLVLLVLALIAAIVCYFAVPSFKKTVDDYLQSVFNKDDHGTNAAKGESELRVHYLDVGQGDSVLIEFPDDTNMLIDSGDRNNDTAEYIVDYLSGLDIEVLDYLMLTHTDSDHVGNMVQVLEAFEVEKAYVPYIEEGVITTKVYANFLAALGKETYTAPDGERKACEVVYSEMGEVIDSENETDDFFMAFLSPLDKDNPKGEYWELNHAKSPSAAQKNAVSPITYLEYMGKKIVFTGDVVGEPAERVMENYEAGVYNNMFSDGEGGYYSVNFAGGVDVYKAAHHGSATHGSNSAAFIEFMQPKYAVVSVGAGNSYGLPDADVLTRFENVGAAVYRTDVNGTVVVTIEPEEEKEVSLFLTAQDQTVNDGGLEEAAAYAVSKRKIKVNFVEGSLNRLTI